MLESILTLASVVLFLFGIAILSLAFKSGYNRISTLVAGLLIIALSMYLMPHQDSDQPDIEYRK